MEGGNRGTRPEARTLRYFAALASLGLCLAIAGCGPSARPLTLEQKQALVAAAAAPSKLQAGEKILVTVYGEPSLSGDYQIDPSGYVSLPLAGTIRAAGLTEDQFADRLGERLSRGYLKNPKITVSITEYIPFYILGEVRKPGEYPYSAGMNVFNAIAIAGGLTYRADRSVIMIEHKGQAEMHSYDLSWPIPILSGDIIKVPMRYF